MESKDDKMINELEQLLKEENVFKKKKNPVVIQENNDINPIIEENKQLKNQIIEFQKITKYFNEEYENTLKEFETQLSKLKEINDLLKQENLKLKNELTKNSEENDKIKKELNFLNSKLSDFGEKIKKENIEKCKIIEKNNLLEKQLEKVSKLLLKYRNNEIDRSELKNELNESFFDNNKENESMISVQNSEIMSLKDEISKMNSRIGLLEVSKEKSKFNNIVKEENIDINELILNTIQNKENKGFVDQIDSLIGILQK